MPRATANVTICRPVSPSVRLEHDDATRLRAVLGARVFTDEFRRRLETAVSICRQHIRRGPPTEEQADLALEQIAKHAQALVLLLGRPGDAVDGPLARLRRALLGGLDQLRRTQDDLEALRWVARQAQSTAPSRDLNMSPRSAKVSLCCRIAELLDDYDIIPVLTTEPKPSAYLQVVKVALGYVGSGDMREIPSEGLKAWRDHVQEAMAGPAWWGNIFVPK